MGHRIVRLTIGGQDFEYEEMPPANPYAYIKEIVAKKGPQAFTQGEQKDLGIIIEGDIVYSIKWVDGQRVKHERI